MEAPQVPCPTCQKVMRKDNLERHMKRHQKPCRECNKVFTNVRDRAAHEKSCRRVMNSSNYDCTIANCLKPNKSALNNRFMEFCLDPDTSSDPIVALDNSMQLVEKLLTDLLKVNRAIKYNITFDALMKKNIFDEEDEFGFKTKTTKLLQGDDLSETVESCKEKILKSLDEFLRRGSGWIFLRFSNICIHATEYRPTAGGSFIELVPELKKKRSLLNIKNKDDKCILYCIAAAKYPKISKGISNKAWAYKEDLLKIKTDGVEFPVTLKDISRLERLNAVRINVFGYDSCPDQPKDKVLNTGIYV